MKTSRPSFVLQSFWTAVVALAMFTSTYAPHTLTGKLVSLAIVSASCLAVVGRFLIARILSDKDQTVSEDVVARVLMAGAIIAVFNVLYWFDAGRVVTPLACIAAATIAAVAAERSHDFSDRDVHETQLRVFYSVPPVVAVALTGAYVAGVSVWFVIGFGLLTIAAHVMYGRTLDQIEAKPSNVIPLQAVEAS